MNRTKPLPQRRSVTNDGRAGTSVTRETTALDRLRKIAELFPASASVTLTREALLEILDGGLGN